MNKIFAKSYMYCAVTLLVLVLSDGSSAKDPSICSESKSANFGVLAFGSLIDLPGEYYVKPADKFNYGAEITLAKPRMDLVAKNCEGITRGFLQIGHYVDFSNSYFAKGYWNGFTVTKKIDGIEFQRKNFSDHGVTYTELLLKNDEYFALIIDVNDKSVDLMAEILQNAMAGASKTSPVETRETMIKKLEELKRR